jgi:hypothetical protein
VNTRCLERSGTKLRTVRRDPKEAGFLQPHEVAKVLHTTTSGIDYLCRTGALLCIRDDRGYRWFDPGEVKALAAARGVESPITGATCARVFELFDAHTPLPEIVKQLSILPEQVRKLWLEYSTPLGRDVPRMARFMGKEEKRLQAAHEEEMRALDAQLYEHAGLSHAPAVGNGSGPRGNGRGGSGSVRKGPEHRG